MITKYNIPPELEPLIPGFLERREKDIGFLKLLLTTYDYKQIRYIAHMLKGQGSSYGFNILSTLGSDLERASREENYEEVRDIVNEFELAVKGIKKDFMQ